MLTSNLHRILFIGALVATAALLADAWRSARHDSSQLAATIATQKVALQQAADREKRRDTQLAAALASIAAQKSAVKTPRQAAIAIPSALPPLPLPITVHFPDLSAASETPDDSPATISIPQPDLKPLYDDLQSCRANILELDAVKKDLADQTSQADALIHERDAALAAAHGGAFWLRLKREVKWFAIGIAAGAAITAAARH